MLDTEGEGRRSSSSAAVLPDGAVQVSSSRSRRPPGAGEPIDLDVEPGDGEPGRRRRSGWAATTAADAQPAAALRAREYSHQGRAGSPFA